MGMDKGYRNFLTLARGSRLHIDITYDHGGLLSPIPPIDIDTTTITIIQ